MLSRARRTIASAFFKAGRALDTISARLHEGAPDLDAETLRAIKENARFENAHAGRPAFVIGNGSSLAGQDLTPLSDQITFVANAFWRHPIMQSAHASGSVAWCPTYYSIIDPLYTDGSAAMADFHEQLCQRATRSTFLISARAMNVVKEQSLLPMDRVCPCAFWGNVERMRRFNFDLSRPLPHLQSVSLLGIAAALYMGCSPIYLLGMDHDWLSSPTGACRHFYPGLSVENHEEVKAIEREGHYSYLETLEPIQKLFYSYLALAKESERAGVEICNATYGGFLDVFARVDYETVAAGLSSRPRRKTASPKEATDKELGAGLQAEVASSLRPC